MWSMETSRDWNARGSTSPAPAASSRPVGALIVFAQLSACSAKPCSKAYDPWSSTKRMPQEGGERDGDIVTEGIIRLLEPQADFKI